MKTYTTVLLILAAFSLQAQPSDLVVFSEMGEKFTLLVNGEQINGEPASRVEKRGIGQQSIKAVLRFEEVSKGIITKNFFLEPGLEYLVNVKLTNKGKYVMRLAGTSPVSADPGTESVAVSAPVVNESAPAHTGTTMTTNTTTEENVNVSMEAAGVSMSVSIPGQTTTHTTSTTVTSSSTVTTNEVQGTPATVGEATTGNCGSPTTDQDFSSISKSISSKTFEDSKLEIAKEVTPNKCLTASKIKQVMELFTYEETRLEYAKFAFEYCFDPDNYYQVYDAFTFETSIDELRTFTKSKR
jgi:hypothetical protein